MKTRTKILALLIVAVLALSVLVTATFALTNYFTVKLVYPYSAGTDDFTVNSTNSYHNETSVSAGASSAVYSIYKNNKGSTTVTSFDFAVLVPSGNVALAGNTPIVKSLTDGTYYIFKDITYNGSEETPQTVELTLSGITPGNMQVFVVTHRAYNTYVSTFFELKAVNNENLYNTNDGRTEHEWNAYRNVYILDSFEIDEDFTINYPCYIDFLYSDVTLSGNLTIAHNAQGAYELNGIAGYASIVNNAGRLNINAPNSYYRTAGIETLLTDTSNYTKSSDNIDFSLSANENLLASLLDDATAFYLATIQDYTFKAAILPLYYHNYGVTYSLTSSDTSAFTALGKVTRGNDSASVTLTVTASLFGATDTAAKTISVVGTSSLAIADSFEALLDDYILNVGKSVTVGLVAENYFDKDIELVDFVNDYLNASSTNANITLELSASNNIAFRYNNSYYAKLELLYDEINSRYDVSFDGNAPIAFDSVNEIVLSRAFDLFDSLNVSLNIIVGAVTDTLTVNLPKASNEEMEAYIERYIDNVYFTSYLDSADLISFGENCMYLGDDTTPTLNTGLSFSNIAYNFYLVDTDDLTAYKAGTMTRAEIIAAATDFSHYLTVTDNVLTPNSNSVLRIDDSSSILIDIALAHFDSSMYYTCREILIPSTGLGGNEYLEYVRGNTFSHYFDSLPDGKLIDSTADVKIGDVITPGTAYRFRSEIPAVHLLVEITNAEDISSFCSIIESANGDSQIDIDIDNAPSSNTLVKLKMTFYINDMNSPVSEQVYSFILPGIYKTGAGNDIPDEAVYARIIGATDTGGTHLYESFSGYLLVDGAKASVDEFYMSLSTLGVESDYQVDLTGINLLANTRSFIFDNCNLTSLAPLGDFATHVVENISLINTDITDAMLNDGSLYALNNLITAHLEQNNISSLKDANGNVCLYRTVNNLFLDDQNNLSDISGIEDLPRLKTVSLTGNKISDFEPLIEIDELTDVYLADNNAVEFATKYANDTKTYYGANGLVNLTNYVELIDKGVNVYLDNSDEPITIGDGINDDITTLQRKLAVALNSIYTFDAYYDNIIMPTRIYKNTDISNTNNYYAVDLHYLLGNTVVLYDKINGSNANVAYTAGTPNGTLALTNAFDGHKLRVIISITATENQITETVYKEFEFLYKKTAIL